MTVTEAIDLPRVIEDGMSDPEFSREMRFFTGRLKIDLAGNATVARFDDGSLVSTSEASDDADCKIVVRGTEEHWSGMLNRPAKPFYQCLQTTAVRHGLYMSATNETFAYLPALNRLLVLMQDAYEEGAR